jgi:hypothetical protein
MAVSSGQTGKDSLIEDLISRASLAIMEHARREFITDGSLSTTRLFVYEGGGILDLAPFDLRTLTSVTIDTDGTSPADTVLTADQYRCEPRSKRHGVWTHLQLRGLSPRPASSVDDWVPSREVEIVGTWGFAAVPEDVAQATILTVMHMYRHFGQAYQASAYGDGVDVTTEGRRALPFAAVEMLRPYRRLGA